MRIIIIKILITIIIIVCRLTPAVVMLLLITMFILPHLGSGPLWERALEKKLTETCHEKWWTLLIYMQNYIRTDIEV